MSDPARTSWIVAMAALCVLAALAVAGHRRVPPPDGESVLSSSADALPDVSPATSTTTTSSTTAPPTTSTTVPPTTVRPSRGTLRHAGQFEATCYSLTGTTASGTRAGPGAIAVDPDVIPLGTRLRVSGYGEGVAVDTGRLIKGHRIDVWKESGCLGWGRRWVTVEVIG